MSTRDVNIKFFRNPNIRFENLIIPDTNFWATVCKTVCPMLSDHCPVLSVLSCLSVTLVYCGQTVRWIKTKLGTQVGLASGQIVLYGNPAPLPQRDTHPNFWSISVVANGWMDQDATWYGGRPRPRPHCVRWEPSSPRKGHSSTAVPPLFGPCLLWPNGRPCQTVAHC